MGVALLSLTGMLVSAYLWLFKHGYIGSLACGTGGCETVQLSEYSRFLGVDVALLGFLAYALLLVIAVIGTQSAGSRRRRRCSWRRAAWSSPPISPGWSSS